MNQATLELDQPATDTVDRTGFDIGWDHAHHGLVPSADLLHGGAPICQGWMAGKAVFGRRTLSSSRATRQWLELRIRAWRHGQAFEGQQVTPNYLAQIHLSHCPVLRVPIGGAAGQADAATITRINPLAAYAAGNLVMVSEQAAAMQPAGLGATAARRLMVLRSFATPLPFAQAACLPLAVLPPNRVRLLNAAQGLQALVTILFMATGWAARCRQLAQWLPEPPLRHDFNLFVGAMAPRVLEAAREPRALRHALEDAWLQERVLRRWQHFVLSLGEAATEALLERATAAGLAGKHTLSHAPQQAIEGWALPERGRATFARVAAMPRRTRPPRAWSAGAPGR